MSRWGSHPLPTRSNAAAMRALPHGGCTDCRYLWRCGFNTSYCWRCATGPLYARLSPRYLRRLLEPASVAQSVTQQQKPPVEK